MLPVFSSLVSMGCLSTSYRAMCMIGAPWCTLTEGVTLSLLVFYF